jgi:hypothetical protein
VGVGFQQFDELIAVFGLHLDLDNDPQTTRRICLAVSKPSRSKKGNEGPGNPERMTGVLPY